MVSASTSAPSSPSHRPQNPPTMPHVETEDPNKPPNHTNKQMDADSVGDFAAEKPESHSPEKHEKKKKKRKKTEIQLANAAEAVTGDDRTATDVVVEAPSSSKSGDKKSKKRKKREIQLANCAAAMTGDDLTTTEVVEDAPSSSKSSEKKSKKRKKEYDDAAGGENGAAEMSAIRNRDGSDGKKKKREVEIAKDTEAVTPEEPIKDEKKMGNALTANTKNGVEEAPSVTKSSDKKSKKRDKEKGVAAGGENGTANVSESGKEHASNANDVVVQAPSSSKSDDKKSRKRKKENDVLAGGENSTTKISEEGLDDSTIMKPGPKNKEKDVGTAEMGGSAKEGDSDDSATSKPRPKKKRNKGKDVAAVGTETEMSNASKTGASDNSQNAKSRMKKPSKPRKRVSFAGEVEVFDDKGKSSRPEEDDDALVQGIRFTPEEDDIIKEAVRKFIEGNQLGEEGLQMVLNNKKYPHLIGCWKEIGASLPRRPFKAVYFRAHNLFERSEARKWQPHEYETLARLHEQFGPDWKIISAELGKHRIHVKDTWRRIGMVNRNRGNWSQEEYQSLFDLVNLDLAMKAFDEKKTKHGMLRDNISWSAISTKLSTRAHFTCCNKWYRQLSSPLVRQGLWLDTDDYRLLDALQKLDACCIDDVDWDNLIKYRSGDVCRKRWEQMVRHIGGHREKSFIEQLDVLSKRYSPEMLQYRKDEGSSNTSTPDSGTSPHEETGQDKHVPM